MEARAYLRNARIAPRKVQIVLDLIRNKPAKQALAILKYTPKAACEPVEKLLKSAIANAENNHNMDANSLYVAECFVGQGPTMKRVRPRAQGRAYRVLKRTSNITIVVKQWDRKLIHTASVLVSSKIGIPAGLQEITLSAISW